MNSIYKGENDKLKKDEPSHIYDQYYEILQPALTSKAEEFFLLGYGEIKNQDLWICLKKKVWKNPSEDIHLYKLVADIISLKVGDYMNFATVEAFQSPDIFSDSEGEEMHKLLHSIEKN